MASEEEVDERDLGVTESNSSVSKLGFRRLPRLLFSPCAFSFTLANTITSGVYNILLVFQTLHIHLSDNK